MIFGRIVAAAIDEDCLGSPPADQYFRLRPVFFLEEGTYGSIDTAKRIGASRPAEQPLAVVELSGAPGDREAGPHAAFLRSLRDSGVLMMAGPYPDGDARHPAEMYVLAVSPARARAIAEADPLVRAGARYAVRRWMRTF